MEHGCITSAKTGRLRCNDRNTINVILFVLTTGCRRADMPDRYGSKSTAYLRFSELQQKGIWKRILSGLIKPAHRQGKTSLQKISIDSSSVAPKRRGTKQDMTGSGRSWAQKYTLQQTGQDCQSQSGPALQMSMTVQNSLVCQKTSQNMQMMV